MAVSFGNKNKKKKKNQPKKKSIKISNHQKHMENVLCHMSDAEITAKRESGPSKTFSSQKTKTLSRREEIKVINQLTVHARNARMVSLGDTITIVSMNEDHDSASKEIVYPLNDNPLLFQMFLNKCVGDTIINDNETWKLIKIQKVNGKSSSVPFMANEDKAKPKQLPMHTDRYGKKKQNLVVKKTQEKNDYLFATKEDTNNEKKEIDCEYFSQEKKVCSVYNGGCLGPSICTKNTRLMEFSSSKHRLTKLEKMTMVVETFNFNYRQMCQYASRHKIAPSAILEWRKLCFEACSNG